MNYFYNLPPEIQEKIYCQATKLTLQPVLNEIEIVGDILASDMVRLNPLSPPGVPIMPCICLSCVSKKFPKIKNMSVSNLLPILQFVKKRHRSLKHGSSIYYIPNGYNKYTYICAYHVFPYGQDLIATKEELLKHLADNNITAYKSWTKRMLYKAAMSF